MAPKTAKAPKKSGKQTTSPDLSPFVVVRTFSAGVHCGRLVSRNGREVELADSRRLWRWRGANTLNEISQKGVAEEWTRLSEPVPSIVITEATEILLCSAAAAANLQRSRWGE